MSEAGAAAFGNVAVAALGMYLVAAVAVMVLAVRDRRPMVARLVSS